MEPELQKLAADFEGQISIAKVDWDASPDLVKKYAVSGPPTLVLLKDGKETGRIASSDPTAIKELLETAM